jgi:hypothetical protein
VGALEQTGSAALATPVAAAATYVQRQPVRNADETSWREKTKRVWLWISVTPGDDLSSVEEPGRGGGEGTVGGGRVGHDRDGSLRRLSLA